MATFIAIRGRALLRCARPPSEPAQGGDARPNRQDVIGRARPIASRLGARKGHFMPPSLLASQFATLEPPAADEAGVVRVPIEPPVETVVGLALDGIAAAQP